MTLSTKFADQGTRVSVLTFDENQITDALKPAVYSVGFNPMAGFFLTKRGERLTIPEKIYGPVNRKVSKILRSYSHSTKSFGVLLSGDKGSGKTMTSSLVANRCIEELNMPVILIEGAFDGGGLTEFVEKLGECVLFIDEFGKKFNDEEGDQGSLLGLFDGTGSSRRLVLLTENNVRDINQYMMNRPGRVHYHFRHEKLDEQIVREYCQDRDITEMVIEQICLRREASKEFSFDVLQAIVNEYLFFGGDITEICDDLNIERPFEFSTTDMEVLEIMDMTAKKPRTLYNQGASMHFPSANDSIAIQLVDLEDEDDYDYCHVSVKNIVKKEGDIYTFALTSRGHDIVMTARQRERTHGWYS
ncbi:AAA family ATPase [Marinobacter shengliensis]|uniref:AAA family ATPase n=1 Tax=Marinobacter shengliensis TaxID=1389223 RepID=UPI001E64C4CB|nr:AAA family ATPase [Marinobacter shengliensis]MCD1628507.1 AAA family ATPase [Marinobacter shengliensis]